jgi:hypothetical protein
MLIGKSETLIYLLLSFTVAKRLVVVDVGLIEPTSGDATFHGRRLR